ncbi:MAG: NADH-quinone oxidoreductase subunit L [Nitrososphaeria archaeon]
MPQLPWLVSLAPIIAGLLVPLVRKAGKRASDYFVVGAGLLTVVLALLMVPEAYGQASPAQGNFASPWIPPLDVRSGMLVDPLSVLFSNLVAFVGFVVLLYSLGYMQHEEGLTRYYLLVLVFIGSMMGLVLSDNMIQMYIFWELVGVCSYLLISFWYHRTEAVKGGIKAFLMTRVGDVALLIAILFIYASSGSASFREILAQPNRVPSGVLSTAAFLVLVGAMAKSAQLPLHTWLYSAMEAPTSVSCLLHGATMVKAGVYLIARTLPLFTVVPGWSVTLLWGGAFTAVFGATLALHTPDIKGVPAYSTVSQIGFMMAALGTASSSASSGWFAGVFHGLSHAFFQGLGFLTVGSIIHQMGTRDMRRMGGLRKDMPVTFGLSLIVILSRSGIPPFSSFFSKGLIADSISRNGNGVALFMIYVAAAITFAYSLRFLALVFTGRSKSYTRKIHVEEAPRSMLVACLMLAIPCVLLGFMEPILISFTQVNVVFSLGELTSPSFVLFMLSLAVAGVPTYLAYWKPVIPIARLRKGTLSILDKLLANGYYFDFLYEQVLTGGLVRFTHWFQQKVEYGALEQFPYVMARYMNKVSRTVSFGSEGHLDKVLQVIAHNVNNLSRTVSFGSEGHLDRILNLFSKGALHWGRRTKRIHTGVIQDLVIAAAAGLLLMLMLLIAIVLA